MSEARRGEGMEPMEVRGERMLSEILRYLKTAIGERIMELADREKERGLSEEETKDKNVLLGSHKRLLEIHPEDISVEDLNYMHSLLERRSEHHGSLGELEQKQLANDLAQITNLTEKKSEERKTRAQDRASAYMHLAESDREQKELEIVMAAFKIAQEEIAKMSNGIVVSVDTDEQRVNCLAFSHPVDEELRWFMYAYDMPPAISEEMFRDKIRKDYEHAKHVADSERLNKRREEENNDTDDDAA